MNPDAPGPSDPRPPRDAPPAAHLLEAAAVRQSRDILLFVRQADGRILEANPAAIAAYGYARDELLSMRIHDLRTPEERPAVEAQMREAGARGVLVQSWHLRKDGTRFPVEVSARGVVVDGVPLLISAVRDTSERKRVEEALRRSEARYRLLHENLRDAFVQVDMEGRLVEFNDLYCEMLGYRPDELRSLSYTDLTPARWHAMEAGIVREQILARGYSDVYEKEYRRKDGRVFPVELRTILARDELGRPQAMWAIVRDITERKRAEEAIREADRQKSDFLAVLSHELRNPLAPIRNSLHILDQVPPGSPAAARAGEVLRRQTDQLTRLVDDLLDLTRISRGKIELQRARLDARVVVRRACEDVGAAFDDRAVSLQVEVDEEPLWIDADAARLAQMTGNLLANALKFTPRGGAVHVRASRAAEACEIAVRDTGAGIDPADLERIFDPFVQAERTRAQRQGGLGIGLPLARDLAALHGGTIRALSDGPGRGAAFVLRLPLAGPPLAPAARAPGPAAPSPGGDPPRPLRIVIVEDNADAAASLAELLALDGHGVRVAGSGSEGLRALADAPADVLICDIGLPDMTGHDVVRAARATGFRAFAIALTGYAQDRDRALALAAGFDAHLGKPPALDGLLALLRSAGDRAAAGA